MKPYTNLLPQEEQQDISLERIQSRLLNFFILVTISVLIVALLFFLGRLYLSSRISDMRQQIEDQQKLVSKENNQKLKKSIDTLNAHLNNLVSLEQHHAQWSEALIAFARLVPQDVAVDSFTATRQTGVIKISGFAKTRDSVLQLRTNLLSSPYFKDVDFPLSNLNRATDASYHYSFTINQDELIKAPSP